MSERFRDEAVLPVGHAVADGRLRRPLNGTSFDGRIEKGSDVIGKATGLLVMPCVASPGVPLDQDSSFRKDQVSTKT